MSERARDRHADPQGSGLLILREDAQYRRIPGRQRVALVQAALDDGRSLADQISSRWGRDPSAIASNCNVPVRRSHEDGGYGGTVFYAEYIARPCGITLYLPAIQKLDRLIAGQGQSYGRTAGTLPIFLAHELYHHFDCQRGNARLSRRHAIPIFSIGAWHWKAGLSSLCEIAAGAFAQQLLGLPFHPKYLDSLVRADLAARPELS